MQFRRSVVEQIKHANELKDRGNDFWKRKDVEVMHLMLPDVSTHVIDSCLVAQRAQPQLHEGSGGLQRACVQAQ